MRVPSLERHCTSRSPLLLLSPPAVDTAKQIALCIPICVPSDRCYRLVDLDLPYQSEKPPVSFSCNFHLLQSLIVALLGNNSKHRPLPRPLKIQE